MASSSNPTNEKALAIFISDDDTDDEVFDADPIRYIPPPPYGPEQRPANEYAQTSARKKRELGKSVVTDERAVYFELYRCHAKDETFLVMTEVVTDSKTFYKLSPIEENGKKKMKAKEINLEKTIIIRHLGEIASEFGNSSDLSISQRLQGWKMETRTRTGSTKKTEKFFSHNRRDKIFRSMTHESREDNFAYDEE